MLNGQALKKNNLILPLEKYIELGKEKKKVNFLYFGGQSLAFERSIVLTLEVNHMHVYLYAYMNFHILIIILFPKIDVS
jgi:hypothetical protein